MGEQGQPEIATSAANPPAAANTPEQEAARIELISLKETFIKAANALDQMKEPILELVILRDAMQAAVKNNRCASDDAFAKFLWDDMGPGLAKRLQKERSNDEKYLEVVGGVLEVLVRLFGLDLKEKRYNFNFYSAMTLLFNHEAIIHKYHFQIPESELKKLRTADQVWRKELQVDSWVDAYVKADERGRLGGWMQAKIISINQDLLQIEFPKSSNAFDGSIDRWSTELMPFESKTKLDYEWRDKFLVGAEMLECDIHDKSVWCKGTVFEVKNQTVAANRVIRLAYCAFRVYRENPSSLRKDERGAYEGWSVKFDEWIPVYSPRIMPWASKVAVIEEEEIEEEMDELIECDPEFTRVYAVPRIFTCISALYLRYINVFGNEGGFDLIIDLLLNAKISEENSSDQLNINIMGCLAQILTMPYPVFHKDFIAEKGAQISKAIQHRLLSTTDQSLRNVRKEQIDAIIKSVDQISRRFLPKDEREKQAEVLRLELANKSLKSTYLERRIQGIRDLNQVIKNNTLYMSSKTFTTEFLIDWMTSNEVFKTIWDNRKTHQQLVQRSNEIFKLLLKEDRLDEPLLKLFWSLTKSDYQAEIYTIIRDTSFYLKQPQIEFLFNEITSQVADKLSLAEFDCLCDLGKACKNQEFQNKITNFFWHIIINSESFKEDLVENSTKKFTEMVKYWSLDQKKPLLTQLINQLARYDQPALPAIRLFTKLIKDQLSRVTSSATSSVAAGNALQSSNSNIVATYTTQTSTGNVVTSYSYKPTSTNDEPEESIYNTNQQSALTTTVIDASSTSTVLAAEKELTFNELLNSLSSQLNIVDILLQNLTYYCASLKTSGADFQVDRRKLHIASKKYSHAEEIEERLQFLKYYASVCDYQFRKVQLRVIYDSLSTESPIANDQLEFLNWCKQACETNTSTTNNIILDLNEVGEYFTELIHNKSISVETLPIVGFEFVQNYFISVNENLSNLLRVIPVVVKPTKQVSSNVTWNSYYVAMPPVKAEVEEDQSTNEPQFKVVIHPSELQQLDLIWTVVLNSKNDLVVQKSIDFLIKIYMSIDEGLSDERAKITQFFINECIKLMQQSTVTSLQIQRITMVLRSIIQESEKKGAGDVQPHNAILKGENLDRIIIKNQTRPNQPNLIVRVLTSATVWEFVNKVSRMIDLAPHYVEFKLSNGVPIKDSDYGKTLRELSFKNYDIISVKKLDFEDEVIPAFVIDPTTNELTDRAREIFNEWFDNYSTSEGVMTPQSTTLFIKGATHENVSAEDGRIKGLFSGYDQNKDGKLERHEFLQFYTEAARDKVDRVYDNLKNHFIRADLVKLSDVVQSNSYAKEDMPRFTLSHNQQQFDLLMSLLDRKDESSDFVWQLIRMLATNQKIYNEVLTMENAVQLSGEIDWKIFFDGESVYRQIYNLEIIEAIMEADESTLERVSLIGFQDQNTIQSQVTKTTRQISTDFANEVMKQSWSKSFLNNGGLIYVYQSFMNTKSDNIQGQFELKKIQFMLAILRVFLSAAFGSQNDDIQHSLQLARRSSSIQDSKQQEAEESQVRRLTQLMEGPIAIEILDAIQFKELQDKLLTLIANTVKKEIHLFEDKTIVQNALNLLIGCQLFKPELFLDFLTFENIEEIYMSGILYCTAEKIRDDFKNNMLELAKQLLTSSETESALGFQLKLLSNNFHKINAYPCRQFFDLFNELIDFYFLKATLGTEEKELFDPERLLSQIIDKIRSDKAQKNEDGGQIDEAVLQEQAVEKERLMVGLIQLTGKIITKVDQALSEKIVKDKDLINEIFKEFLFSSVFNNQSSNSSSACDMLELAKAKMPRKNQNGGQNQKVSTKSREAAYQLLSNLIRKSPLIMNNFIRDQLKPLLDMIKRPKQWNYTPPNATERLHKYVGLKNLGCICYMNSMLQQFFMIPAFRYNLLCVDDGVKPDITEYKGEMIDDNMLHQMQRLFANLELSERMDYNPLSFTFAFKEFDGNPTNTAEQKDAQEFLNVLFDRVENALKPTSKKYLLQSIFGGKTCSQLVCQECGKIKNRIEDYYNMSLTVKDIKSVYDSLAKQVEGEVINDYQCEGCNKKVDVSKRVLIAETPNVLILHLQRIVFNFDTFRNDKLNQHFEFPTVLDLKPYSYYDVMRREQRLPKDNSKTDDADLSDEVTDDKQDKKEENADEQMPIEDDCFEYKLVGVNVHSGSANAGHYWSYINTVRGLEEKDTSDPTWFETENDQWMEFNDSTVREYKFANLKEECFGDKPGGSQSFASAWGISGGYGKSGYMLFYERRVKKPIRIVVPAEEAANQADVVFDEKTKEHIKLIAYREGVDKETPNQIFQKVLEDNTKFTFENDIYSQEFFDFLKQILQNVAQFGNTKDTVHNEMRQQSLQIAKKAAFDILARCFYNQGIKDLVQVMIEIFKLDENLIVNFCSAIIDNNSGEALLEILLDCTDQLARTTIAYLFKFLLCSLKRIEKEYLLTLEDETLKQEDEIISQPKAVSARYMNLLVGLLNTRVVKSWARFENYLELISSFALLSAEEVQQAYLDLTSPQATTKSAWSIESEAAQTGLEYFFKINMIERLLDFVLGPKSPLLKAGEFRAAMGGSYQQPNLSSIMKVITTMFTAKNLIEKYPLSPIAQKMLQNREILAKILEENAANKDFASQISNMCKENFEMTKKMAKVFLKSVNQPNVDKVSLYLKSLKKFLLINDSLKIQRLEWIFGISQLVSKSRFRSNNKYEYGVELVERINDDAYTYISTLMTTTTEDALMSLLLKQRGRMDTFCIKALKDLISLCIKDIDIARYIYKQAPHSYQYARYSDWFRGYIEGQQQELEKSSMSAYTYYQTRIIATQKAVKLFEKFQELTSKFEQEEVEIMATQTETAEFQELQKVWLYPTNKEIIAHYPPQYIIGKQVGEDRELARYEDDCVIVTVQEISCEFMYSNPTGLFNLSLPEKLMRTKNYTFISYQQFKEYTQKTTAAETGGNNEQTETDASEITTRDWSSYKEQGPVLVLLQVRNKQSKMIKVEAGFTLKGDKPNISVSSISQKQNVFSGDTKVFAHFQKINPTAEWNGEFVLNVNTFGQTGGLAVQSQKQIIAIPEQLAINAYAGADTDYREGELRCGQCFQTNYIGMEYCQSCGESLKDDPQDGNITYGPANDNYFN